MVFISFKVNKTYPEVKFTPENESGQLDDQNQYQDNDILKIYYVFLLGFKAVRLQMSQKLSRKSYLRKKVIRF
jgi:hypothetical protein